MAPGWMRMEFDDCLVGLLIGAFFLRVRDAQASIQGEREPSSGFALKATCSFVGAGKSKQKLRLWQHIVTSTPKAKGRRPRRRPFSKCDDLRRSLSPYSIQSSSSLMGVNPRRMVFSHTNLGSMNWSR